MINYGIALSCSERIGKSGATGTALKEAQSINKSLSALGDVIMSRAQKSSHVPFRNSMLTHLLQVRACDLDCDDDDVRRQERRRILM